MGHRVPNAACRPDARPRPRTQERRQGIGGKPTDSTPRNEVCFVSQSVLTQSRSRRAAKAACVETSSTHQRCLRAMSATLAKQFERFAECCLELARGAKTTARRARFIQMAHEYQLAMLLIRGELSPDLRSTTPTQRLHQLAPSDGRARHQVDGSF